MIGAPNAPVKAWVKGKTWRRCPDGKGLKGELELLPVAALDSGSHIIAGARCNYHRGGLLAGPAAGEAKFIVG